MKINLEREGKAGNKKYSCIQFPSLRKTQRTKTQNHRQGTEAAGEAGITKIRGKGALFPGFHEKAVVWLTYVLTMKPVICDLSSNPFMM